jgi:hypothetical protein
LAFDLIGDPHLYFHMKPILLSLIALSGIVSAYGKSSYLVLRTQGDGAVVKTTSGIEPLQRASYLPSGNRVTVRPRSGIETMGAGCQFRFGSDTSFTIEEDAITLHQGSLMLLSRKIGINYPLNSPETKLNLSGIGTCMVEVEPNGGLKLLCVLGRIVIRSSTGNFELLAGELIFAKPGGHGLGDRINVNLGTVVKSSYLLSGFPNSTAFGNSLANVVDAQKRSIGKTYRAEVGQAKGANTFEVLPIPDAIPEDAFPAVTPEASKEGYEVSASDPLSELLGRSPKRLVAEEASKANEGPTPRPFPSRLLRPN